MQKLVFRNANGTELDLTSDPFGITEWEGFSADELNIQSQQVPFQDGSVFLDALLGERELAVTVAMNDGNNLEKRYRLRREMISALNPKLGEGVLIYTNDFLSKQIHVIPQLPVFENHNSNVSGTPKVSCVFNACNPYWEDLEDTSVEIGDNVVTKITNEGDIDCGVEIQMLVASETTNPQITNDDKIIKLNGTFENDIFINTNVGQKSAETRTDNYDVNSLTPTEDIVPFIYNNNERAMYFYYNDILLKSFDGGKTIQNFGKMYFGEIVVKAIKGNNNYIVLTSHYLYISTDMLEWTRTFSYMSDLFTDIKYIDDLQKYVIASRNGIWITEDLTNVSKIVNFPSMLDHPNIGYSKTLQKAFVVAGTYIYSSSNLSSWSSQEKTGKRIGWISCGKNVNIITLIQEGITSASILKSYDGTTWEETVIYQGDTISLNYIDCDENDNFCIGMNYRKDNKYVCGVLYGNENNFLLSDTNVEITSSDRTTGVQFCKEIGGYFVTNNKKPYTFRALFNNGVFIYSKKEYQLSPNAVYVEERNMFYNIASSGVVRSRNGIEWEELSTDVRSNYSSKLVYIKEKDLIIALTGISESSSRFIKTSVDGITWETKARFEESLFGIIYCPDKDIFVVVGDNGFIATSSDLENWTTQTSGISNRILDIAYINKKILCISSQEILLSLDAETWTEVYTGSGLHNISYNEDKNICLISYTPSSVGYLYILYSYDLTNWQLASFSDERNPYFTSYSYNKKNKVFYGVVSLNEVWTSPDGFNWVKITDLFRLSQNTNIVFNYKDNITCFFWGNSLVSVDGDSQNIIDKLSQDSDMKFNLKVGDNILLSNINCILTYRQKYIGV